MHILFIGVGVELPVKGWGAVEAILWELLQRLPKHGVDATHMHVPYHEFQEIPSRVLALNKKCGPFDFVHFNLDLQYPMAESLGMHFPVAMTSHFPHIRNKAMYPPFNWDKILNYFVSPSHQNFNFALSPSSRDYYIAQGQRPETAFYFRNGAEENIRFAETAELPDKTVYLAKIAWRKGQETYADFDCIDFVGTVEQEDVSARPERLKHYLGGWSRDQVRSELTKYANLALLSLAEEAPLVVREALMAGLGVVVSECSTEWLDCSLPFIDVVPDDKLRDLAYVEAVLAENRRVSRSMRSEIRAYAVEQFGWESCVKFYIEEVKRALASRQH